jgi:hypothetical protein
MLLFYSNLAADCGVHAARSICPTDVQHAMKAKFEHFKAQHIGHHRAVRVREGIPGEIWAAPKAGGHPRNHLLVLAERVDDELEIQTMLDCAPLVLRPSL